MKSINRFCILLTVFATVFAVTGCSSTSKTTVTGTTTLYWWRPMDDAPEETLKQIVTNYTSSHSGVKIEIVTKDPRTYEQEVIDALAANQSVSNAPDIISIDANDLPRFVPQLTAAPDDMFESLATKSQKLGKTSIEYVQTLYEDSVVKSTIFNDSTGNAKLYGLPMGVDNLVLYINKSLISKAVSGLSTSNSQVKDKTKDEISLLSKKIQATPKTWTDLTDIIPYITVKDGSDISVSGIALGTGTNVERSYDILQTLMMQTGTQMTSDGLDSATFNQSLTGAASSTNPGESALKFYLRFSNPNDPLYSWNEKMPNDVDAFIQGQLAMMIHYEDVYRFMIAESQTIKSQIDVQALPQVNNPDSPTSTGKLKTMAKMRVEAVPSAKGDSKKQNAAWTFVHYLGSKDGSNAYLSSMKISSPLKEVASKAKFKAVDTQKTIADTWYKGHKSLEVDKLFITMIEDSRTGKKTTKDALDKAATDTSTILQASKSKWATAAATTSTK